MDFSELEKVIGQPVPDILHWFYSQVKPDTLMHKTFDSSDGRWRELRRVLPLADGTDSVIDIFRELGRWTKGEFLPLLNDMQQQYIGVRIKPPRIGQVIRTDNYLGHPDDNVTFRVLGDDLKQWWNELRDLEAEREDEIIRIARSGTAEDCERLDASRDVRDTDERGRTLLDFACGFGNMEVVKWCLENEVNGKYALSKALFSDNWNIVELLLSLGWGLDGDSDDTLSGVPVRNHKWLVPPEHREAFERLVRRAEANYCKRKK